jgi:hypothetical protein
VPTFNSKILNPDMFKKFHDLSEFQSNHKWDLLYRASKHGFAAKKFHSKCDNHANTLTIVKSQNGFIFGGYTEQLWNQSGGYKSDPNAFIFSLVNKDQNPIKMKVRKPENAIYCRSDCGPTFGWSSGFSNVDGSTSCSRLDGVYVHPTYAPDSNEARSFLAGSESFQAAEIEVFKRLFK